MNAQRIDAYGRAVVDIVGPFELRDAKPPTPDYGGTLDGTGSSATPANDVVAEIEAAGGEAVACHASVADEAGATSCPRMLFVAIAPASAAVYRPASLSDRT